jgi:cellulose biosynthesis protein BcsQ
LSIRTVTRIRKLAELYSAKHQYDFVIIDTSPNLGALNKVIISTVDGFIIPCLPDMFSLYGIKNIGKALTQWQRDFSICFSIISPEKRKAFPLETVRFLGYTIYNAKKRSDKPNQWGLARAHYNYATQIPESIKKHLAEEVRKHLSEKMVETPIGDNAILHTHNTLANMAQKYRKPMWALPGYQDLDSDDKGTINASPYYKETQQMYQTFTNDFLERVATLDD